MVNVRKKVNHFGGFFPPYPTATIRMKTEVSHLQNVPIWMRQLWFQGALPVQNNSTVIIWDGVLISDGRIFYSGVETIAAGITTSPLEKLNSGTWHTSRSQIYLFIFFLFIYLCQVCISIYKI